MSNDKNIPAGRATDRDIDSLIRSYGRTDPKKVESIQGSLRDQKAKFIEFEKKRNLEKGKNRGRDL